MDRAHNVVELIPYNDEWPARFAAIAAQLSAAIPDAVIEHVGSTSVPGLSSKDTIDIAVGVEDMSAVLEPRVLEQLRDLGFIYAPASFADDPEHAFFARIVDDHRTHHLHVVLRGSATWDEYLLFRDFLHAVPEARERYEEAKQALARQHAQHRSEYVDRKLAVVDGLLEQARVWSHSRTSAAAASGAPSPWQDASLAALRRNLPEAEVEPYGSVLVPASMDSWSDLDVSVRAGETFHLETALGSRIWAYQAVQDERQQVVRTVLEDGRRIDLGVTGAEVLLPEPPEDNAVRFDAALAAVRFGRGSDLIGLHLVLGIFRESLVHRMLAADRSASTTHHRTATDEDRRAADGLSLLSSPLAPATARAVYDHYGAVRAEVDPTFLPSPGGLEAVIARGRACRG